MYKIHRRVFYFIVDGKPADSKEQRLSFFGQPALLLSSPIASHSCTFFNCIRHCAVRFAMAYPLLFSASPPLLVVSFDIRCRCAEDLQHNGIAHWYYRNAEGLALIPKSARISWLDESFYGYFNNTNIVASANGPLYRHGKKTVYT